MLLKTSTSLPYGTPVGKNSNSSQVLVEAGLGCTTDWIWLLIVNAGLECAARDALKIQEAKITPKK